MNCCDPAAFSFSSRVGTVVHTPGAVSGVVSHGHNEILPPVERRELVLDASHCDNGVRTIRDAYTRSENAVHWLRCDHNPEARVVVMRRHVVYVPVSCEVL